MGGAVRDERERRRLKFWACPAGALYPTIKLPCPGPKNPPAKSPGAESGLSFRRKILYYGIMLLLTILASEGMARVAYYAAYNQWYGGGMAAAGGMAALPGEGTEHSELRHPYYGFAVGGWEHALNGMPPPQRAADTVVVGLLGGSLMGGVNSFLQRALADWFASEGRPQRLIIRDFTLSGGKQPQQALIAANMLLLGGEFDLLVNLDGFNEAWGSGGVNYGEGVFPFFPNYWDSRAGLTAGEILLAGRIGLLRREQARLAAAGEGSPLRYSAVFGLVNRWRQERVAAEIILLNHELAAMAGDYSLEKYGPRSWREEGAVFAAVARAWYRGSLTLARLAELGGAEYYHFLQPNQYVPAAKPLSAAEREQAYAPGSTYGRAVARGYPLLRRFNKDLQREGINYFDMTGIFAGNGETLYRDECCHLNDRGYELLAAEMLRRLEPALLRLGRDGTDGPAAALAAGRRPPERGPRDYQVAVVAEGNYLRYTREGCAPADTAALFFLHLTPRELADLPAARREAGFEDGLFSFDRAGGILQEGRCVAQIPLPDYPVGEIRTGQWTPARGELWSAAAIVPVAAAELRAEHAALTAEEPAARDYFDLYRRDNRLVYLRETCAAADTAAAFFLHIVPADVADLPEERREAGFVHAGFDFARRGGPFDGKCLAAVALPDYPIAGLRTGQYVPGQGELWSVELAVGR